MRAWLLKVLGAKPSGTWYCVQHFGVGNEDDSECDFTAYTDEDDECAKRELFYV